MGNFNITATYGADGNWSFSPTQQPNGLRIDVYGNQTVQVTLASAPGAPSVSLPTSTSDYLSFPKGTPSWYDSTTLTPINSNSFSFNDPDPSSSYNVQYEILFGFVTSTNSTPQWTPDPIIINRDPNGDPLPGDAMGA